VFCASAGSATAHTSASSTSSVLVTIAQALSLFGNGFPLLPSLPFSWHLELAVPALSFCSFSS
jgi:hypothetical protein